MSFTNVATPHITSSESLPKRRTMSSEDPWGRLQQSLRFSVVGSEGVSTGLSLANRTSRHNCLGEKVWKMPEIQQHTPRVCWTIDTNRKPIALGPMGARSYQPNAAGKKTSQVRCGSYKLLHQVSRGRGTGDHYCSTDRRFCMDSHMLSIRYPICNHHR